MKKFIFESIFYTILLFSSIIIVSLLIRSNTTPKDYLAAIIDKHNCMQQSMPPRIVFIGDSNLAFGLDSEAIENEFGYPVCNLGLHGGLGLKFVLAEAIDVLQPHDIAILITSWNLGKGQSTEKAQIQWFYPRATYYAYQDGIINSIKTISRLPYIVIRSDYLSLRTFFSTVVRMTPMIEGVYERNAFNRNGDIIRHLEPEFAQPQLPKFKPTLNKIANLDIIEYLEQLSKFQKKIEPKSIQIFYTFPPYPQTLFNQSIDRYQNYEIDVRKELHVTILGHNNTFIFDDSLFYDVHGHLNKSGRELRTQILIDLLKPVLKRNITMTH